MELLLVLALLVIAGSLAIPAITGAFGGVRLRRAGDAVITRWAEARAQAIETGQVYQFRFTPKTAKYRLEPWTVANLEDNMAANGSVVRSSQRRTADSVESATSDAATPATEKTLAESPTLEAALPESITFAGGQTVVDDPVRRERRVDALEKPDDWSSPILFFPDGSASTATVVLQNGVNQYVRLTIRGLTGATRASNVLTQKEYDDSSRER
jgi:Tfp pilus assembly protein FimT